MSAAATDDPVVVGQLGTGVAGLAHQAAEIPGHQFPGRRRTAEELLDVAPGDLGEIGPALKGGQGALLPDRPQQPAAECT